MAQFRTDKRILDSGQMVTRYEVHMLADQITPSGNLLDGYGRIRTTQPFTLFDSQTLYSDNELFDTSVITGATKTFNINESSVFLNVTTASGSRDWFQSV